MADSTKKITTICHGPVNENAGTRDDNGVDDVTCFGIPGSGLPPRHCNTDFTVTAAVCSDLSVYLSVDGGRIYQDVKGYGYDCRLYACRHPFTIYLSTGITTWEEAQFLNSGADCRADVMEIVRGDLTKGNDDTFSWEFGPCVSLSEGQEYYEDEITKTQTKSVSQNGGESKANYQFMFLGSLTDFGWTPDMGSDGKGYVYLCGGIMYTSKDAVTAEITAVASRIEIPGLNLASYYYPGDIQKIQRMSLNRPEGFLRICKPGESSPETYLKQEGIWRDVKNTTNDRAVAAGAFKNWAFRFDGTQWQYLKLTGQGGAVEGDPEVAR